MASMTYFKMKIRYVRHPYLIRRLITNYFEYRLNKCIRVGEYRNYMTSNQNGLLALLGCRENLIKEFKTQLSENIQFQQKLNEARMFVKDFGGGMNEDDCALLYLLVRLLHPTIVVETGCGNGFSSAFILQGLEDNGMGELYSIDLHYREGVAVPIGKQLGWVIPDHLMYRWHLSLGEGSRVLPRLVTRLGAVDIFLHDSRHTYSNMMREFAIVWPYLRRGGLLLSHDVVANDAFLDFCDRVQRSPIVIDGIGIVMK